MCTFTELVKHKDQRDFLYYIAVGYYKLEVSTWMEVEGRNRKKGSAEKKEGGRREEGS